MQRVPLPNVPVFIFASQIKSIWARFLATEKPGAVWRLVSPVAKQIEVLEKREK